MVKADVDVVITNTTTSASGAAADGATKVDTFEQRPTGASPMASDEMSHGNGSELLHRHVWGFQNLSCSRNKSRHFEVLPISAVSIKD